MAGPVIGIIGGSGLYQVDGLDDIEWRRVESPFGRTSDEFCFGSLNGQPVIFVPRHGRGHVLPPSEIDYRANIDALKRCGVTDIVSLSAVGSLREDLAPGDFVLVEQFIDRTFAREKSFFGPGCVAHVSMAHPVCGRVGDALAAAGDLSGRLLVDVTNPLRMGAAGLELSIGFDRSGAEHVASLAPGAAVFKTLNQVGFEVMANAAGYAAPPVMFVAGDDVARKPVVMGLVTDLGFDAVDAGGLRAARLLEPFGMLWIHMAINRKAGRDKIFAYLARGEEGAA